MTRLIWSPLSIDDLENIQRYISHDSTLAAIQTIMRIRRRAESLVKFPLSGTRPAELDEHSDLQEVLSGNYRILFRNSPSAVEVVTVRHAARMLRDEDIS